MQHRLGSTGFILAGIGIIVFTVNDAFQESHVLLLHVVMTLVALLLVGLGWEIGRE